MGSRHTYLTCLDFGDAEIEVEVAFTIIPGCHGTGPTYACGGTPAEPPLIEDVTLLKVDGKPRPWAFAAYEDAALERAVVERLKDHEDQMFEAAVGDGPDPDDAYERARDERLMQGDA